MHLKRTSCNLACVAVYRRLCWYYLVRFQHGGTDLTPLIGTSTSLYLPWFQAIYVCVDLHFGVLCLKCVDCQTQIWPLPTSGLAAAKLWLTRVWQLPNSGLAAATLWFTRVWQLPNSGKCQTRVLVMKNFLRWCYCVTILATFHFVLCWFCLVLFCSILSKRFDLCCSVPIQTTHPCRAKQPCP